MLDRDVDRLRADYEAGDKSALASAILGCARFGRPLPEWAADAFHAAWIKVTTREADWNDALGDVKKKTPKQIERDRLKVEQIVALAKTLGALREVPSKKRDDEGDGLWCEIEKRTGIKARDAKDLYYAKINFNGEKIPLLPRRFHRRSSRKAKSFQK